MIETADIGGSDILDHLGLVAATIDKLGIAKRIDQLLPLRCGAKTTHGQRASAMILNGLGFMDDRLYLFPKFLKNKPVSRLLGTELKAEDFNDDTLGRFLDRVHEYGESKLFSELALPIALQHNMLRQSAHLDTTSLSVYGEYEADEEIGSDDRLALPKQVVPRYGYAKNKRFDLKQMTLLLATTGATGFPIWMESHSGNASDKKTLEAAAQRMQKFCQALTAAPALLYVGDAAIYSNCVKHGSNLLWLTRVPENLKISQELLQRDDLTWIEQEHGYQIYSQEQEYRGVKQRWLLVFSQEAYARELATLNKQIIQEREKMERLLWHTSKQLFGCIEDIEQQFKELGRQCKYHCINHTIQQVNKHYGRGRPKKDSLVKQVKYQVTAELILDETAIHKIKMTKGKFILATNQLDCNALPDHAILPSYKEQAGTESGFKFIKDNAFEVDSIFLKKPGRISALMMVMTLCLMVYSYAQYWLRQQLKEYQATIPSQSGKETNKPSMKWVYRLFSGIAVLKIKVNQQWQELVLNLDTLLCRIIRYFGAYACNIYGIQVTSGVT